MSGQGVRFTAAGALAAVVLALGAYFTALGSDHAATNGDELLYAQITFATAQAGHWLPLETMIPWHRNTKPPALFWQGIVSTDWAQHWSLWNLRWPNVLYTLATAAMVFALARQLGGSASKGLLAALVYLAFFGTYRYGRVFLTSGPETFWLFAPFFLLLWRRPDPGRLTWPLAALFGLMVGVGLLYKSFALVLPATAGLAWWTLHGRRYRIVEWLRADALKIAILGILALGVFSLWYVLDPQRQNILQDFVFRENVGKFNTGGRSYLANLLWGDSSVWRNLISYPFNAGLLAPAVIALVVIAWQRRRELLAPERLLWIWVATVIVVFTLPNQRDERYLLPAMPALAVLLALRWDEIPRWVFLPTLAAVAVIALGMGLGAGLLTWDAGLGAVYPWFFWIIIAATIAFAAYAALSTSRTRVLAAPAVLLLYLCYAAFLIPFDGPRGAFDAAAQEFVRGKAYAAPINFNAREEIYRFLLPGSDPRPYHVNDGATVDSLRRDNAVFIVSVPLRDMTVENSPGLRVVGTRWQLIDRFRPDETAAMLRGDVARHLFKKDLLVEVVGP